MNLNELRILSNLTTRAAAALLPLASDGCGADSHGGRIPDPTASLARALTALAEAGAMVARIQRSDSNLRLDELQMAAPHVPGNEGIF